MSMSCENELSGQACVCQCRVERSHSAFVLLSVLPDAQESQRRLSTHGVIPGDLQ